MNPELERVIHILNPWLIDPKCREEEINRKLPEVYINRNVTPEHSGKWGGKNKAHLIIGPRQAGKSTVIWKYLLESGLRVLYLNCEERLIKEWCASPSIFSDDVRGLLEQIDVIFFEEARHLDNAGLFLKGLVDIKIDKPILVTGSSSYHLHSRIRESLAGRATRTQVTPFTLEELTPAYGHPSESSWRKVAREVIGKQLCFGSYPEVWLSDDKEGILYDLIEAFIIRDASYMFKVKHIGEFRQLLKLISWQIGNLVNYSEWSGIIGIDNNTTKHYVEILQESGIISIAEPYAGGKRSEITSSPNIYFCDVGLRNAFARQFSEIDERGDRGKLFENWVYSELRKLLPQDISIRFWRSKSGSEVDLVLLRGGKITGIEVKCAVLAKGKISRSSRSFIEAYKPERFFIVNRGFEGETKIGKTKVIHTPAELLVNLAKSL